MKLIQPGSFKDTVKIKGVEYKPDDKGIVEIPDELVSSNLYGFGFVRVNEEEVKKEVKEEVKDEIKEEKTKKRI